MEIHVATDLWGRKHNLLLNFATWDVSLAELTVRVESAYRIESIALRPPTVSEHEVPPFMVTAMTILVDEEASKWVELVSAKQLHDRCQIFVFQPPHPFHSDSRDLIPLPRLPLPASSTVHLETYRAEAAMLSQRLSESLPTPQRTIASAAPLAAGSPQPTVQLRPPVSPVPTTVERRPRSPSSRASPSRSRVRFSPRQERAASPGRDYVRPEPFTTTHLDLAHELFGLMDKRNEGSVSVAEVKATLVTAGLVPATIDRSGRLSAGRQRWDFADWAAFCEEHATLLPILAESRGIRLGGFKATNDLLPGQSAGLSHPTVDNTDRQLSPLRSRPTPAERQRAIAERLHGGLASIVTAKDRERNDYSHAVTMHAQSPDRRTHSGTPTRSNRRQ